MQKLARYLGKAEELYHGILGRIKGETSKLLEVVLEKKRREIIEEWIKSGRIENIMFSNRPPLYLDKKEI